MVAEASVSKVIPLAVFHSMEMERVSGRVLKEICTPAQLVIENQI